jgi:hypothetical protein
MMDMSADPGQQQAGDMISPNDVEWVYEVIRRFQPRLKAASHSFGQ